MTIYFVREKSNYLKKKKRRKVFFGSGKFCCFFFSIERRKFRRIFSLSLCFFLINNLCFLLRHSPGALPVIKLGRAEWTTEGKEHQLNPSCLKFLYVLSAN